jgi:cytochrome d ubiquinol oxidase subunit II
VRYPVTFVLPVGVIAALAGIWWFNRAGKAARAFLCSCGYLVLMLVGACWGLFPTLLPATTGAERSITLTGAVSGAYTLQVGLIWWGFGMALAAGYFTFVYWMFRGKLKAGVVEH